MSDRRIRLVTQGIDLLGAMIAAVNFVFVIADSTSPIRPAVALVFVIVIPGWAAVRLFGGPPSAMALLAALMLSIAIAVLTAMVLIDVLDWQWRAAALGWSAASLGALLYCAVRQRRSRVFVPSATGA